MRLLVVCLGFCLARAAIGPSGALAEGSSSLGGYGGLPDESPLVVPEAQALVEGQGAREAEEVWRDSPEAVRVREESQAKYENLSGEEAAGLAQEAFPAMIDEPAGGPPKLAGGQSVVAYLSDNAAQVDLGGGRRAVVESTAPMAVETSAGRRTPVDLSLSDVGSAFEPRSSVAAVRISKRLKDGVGLAAGGVLLTPVDAQGSALDGQEGVLIGASVFYANTQTASDLVAKPTADGFELSSILRSEQSPAQLHFRVGLPEGARLAQDAPGSGVVRVLDEGVVIATILTPVAQDATGTAVPVSMSVSGDTLTITADRREGEYQYPIEVDPTVIDKDISLEPSGNWHFSAESGSGAFSDNNKGLLETVDLNWGASFGPPEWGQLSYGTQGESRIYKAVLNANDANIDVHTNKAVIASKLYIINPGKTVEGGEHSLGQGTVEATTCAVEGSCDAGIGNKENRENAVVYHQAALEQSSYEFENRILNGTAVYIVQVKGPTASFNKEEFVELWGNKIKNALYGSRWATSQWFVQVAGSDPGIGVDEDSISSPQNSKWGEAFKKLAWCDGVECGETRENGVLRNKNFFTLSLAGLPDGEDTVEAYLADAVGLKSETLKAAVKVDNTSPHNIVVTGLPHGNENSELGEGPYHVKVEATDGSGSTPSSGIASIALAVDGREIGKPSGLCSPGPCTAGAEWTISGQEFGTGEHRLKVTATDGAGNVATEEVAVKSHHSAPMPVGPGSVNSQSGELSLGATDVSMSAPGSSLVVGRSYRSRHLTAGSEGPFGPQWSMSLGSTQSLTRLPNGSVAMTNSAGAQTVFARNEKGELTSPRGDANLKLTSSEEAGRPVYYLSDATAGARTKFALPTVVGEAAAPTYSSQFGTAGSGAGQFSHPGDVAVDSKGNLWVLDHGNNRVEEFNAKEEYLQGFGSLGSGNGQLNGPNGVAVDSKGDVWVADTSNNRVEEFTEKGEYQKAFGSLGSGNGQLSGPNGVAVDPRGNVWVADTSNGRLEEFNEKGEYIKTVGSKGTGAGQLGEPMGIAIDTHGNAWVADWSNNRVEEFNEKGEYVRQAGSEGSGNGQFKHPYGIAVDSRGNAWVADTNNDRVQRFNEKAEYIGQFGSKGSGAGQFEFSSPVGIAADSKGDVWATDSNNNRIEKWTLSVPSLETWLPAISEGPVATNTETFSFQTVQIEGRWVIEPTQALAPVPSGVSCSPEIKAGCRALIFTYASETTAGSEAPSEWGDYKGRLKNVSFKAYNPAKEAVQEKTVAQYSYDKQGRMRAEWDPRISPALRTTYGYDTEGHVVALSPPGQQPWLLRYGTSAGDASAGRLLSVTRPAASTPTELTEAEEHPAPVNTAAPMLSSTSPVIGTTLSVSSKGTWSNGPLAYSYSWQDCYIYESKETCLVIPGAVNQSYTPQARDAGYTLRAQVTAVNATGATTAETAASNALVSVPAFLRKFGEVGEGGAQYKGPISAAVDPAGNLWVVDYNNSRVKEVNPETGTLIRAIGWGVSNGKAEFQICTSGCKAGIAGSGAGQFSKTEGIAINQATASVYVVDSGNNRIEEFHSNGTYAGAFGESGSKPGQLSGPDGIAIAPSSGNVWVGDSGNSRVDEFSEGGAYLKSFGVEGTGNGQFKVPDGIVFSNGNAYVVDAGNNRVQEFSMAGEFISKFGAKGTAEGQFEAPTGIATEPVSGDLYIADKGNNRIEEFNPAGVVVAAFGKKGELKGEFISPQNVAVNSAGDVYIPDFGNNRVQEFEPKYSTNNPLPEPPALGTSSVTTIEYNVPLSGAGLQTMTKTELERWSQTDDPTEATAIFPPDEPMGWPAKEYKRATVNYYDELGHLVNVVTPSGGISTTEYNESNEAIRSLSADNRTAALAEGSKSKEASKLLDTESKYNGESKEEKASEPGTQLLETLGPQHTVKLAGGTEVKARDRQRYHYDEGAPGGEAYNLVTKVTDGAQYEGKEADVRTTTTSYRGQEGLGWQLRKPTSVTTDPNGLQLTHKTIYEPATGNVTETTMPAGTPKESITAPTYNLQFKVSRGTYGAGLAIDGGGNIWDSGQGGDPLYKYSGSGTYLNNYGALRFEVPVGVAINQKAGDVYVANHYAERIDEFSTEGEHIATIGEADKAIPSGVAVDSNGNVWDTTGGSTIREYSSSGNPITSFGETGTGEGQLEGAAGIAMWHGTVFVADQINDRVVEFSTSGKYIAEFGSKGSAEGQFSSSIALAIDPTSEILYVVDKGNDRVEEFSITGEYLAQFGSKGKENGQLEEPEGIAINSSGGIYVLDSANKRVEEWLATEPKSSISAHNTQTIYYSAAFNETYKVCGEHPQWANLPCQTQPAKQPETSGLPNLPVTTYTSYSMWDEPETITETVGSTTRRTTTRYDEAGRLKTSVTSSTVGAALPMVTDTYNEKTGALEKQSTITEGKTKTITSLYNTLGQLTSYTDADESTSTYEYDEDGRTKKTNDGKGTQTYTYNETTGLLGELVDSSAEGMKFTASYDVEGNMLSEGYPNGMSANYTYSSVGKPTALEYMKTTHCSEKCTWFSDSVVPSIHGQLLSQTSTLSNQSYAYDAAGRLTLVQNTPAGKGCTTRVYAYDEETNRTSLTTREPGLKGECLAEGGKVEKHTYDEANRLTDTGTAYNTFGDINALPAKDAEEHELTSTYYVDNQLASQTQNGQTIGYNLDPSGRTRETVSTGKATSDVTSHYAGPGGAPAWTVNTSSEWTRNIPGINGTLAAIQNNGETPVLQLTNLHGDIIATAYRSETATELASKADTSEFGVPAVSAPPKYAWLGAIELPTELPSGVVAMGARSYVPQLGRFLQPDPVPGGSANAYTYTFGDPINSTDPTGKYAGENFNFLIQSGAEKAKLEVAEHQAAEEAAARAAAEAAAREAAWEIGLAGPQYEGEEEYWEEWEEYEEEGEYEYISDNGNSGGKEPGIEPALLLQPLTSAEVGGGESTAVPISTVRLCGVGSEGACARDAGGFRGHCMNGSACKRHRHNYTKAQIEQFEHEKCRTVGVGIAVAGYFLPEAKLAKAILAGIGIGTSLSC